MPSKEIVKYFDTTAYRETRDDLRLAVSLVEGDKIAIDCGCGAGSDIAFLRSYNYFVHAFDIEEESIIRCKQRFKSDNNVQLSKESFTTYQYPDASLIVADASLFFCPEKDFGDVWHKITSALSPGGVFSGSFLGPEDTMAGPHYNKEYYWADVLVLTEEKVKDLFCNYIIESFAEYRTSGKTPNGEPHQWHIFSVVAKKVSNNTLKPMRENSVA
ncbi:MAG: class I SAM-dependent methyltransferase [Gammaproteobacteria bacterium]|nr:class I SAM-dependent methyltransferase [Gammaproteobacteria bacterium]